MDRPGDGGRERVEAARRQLTRSSAAEELALRGFTVEPAPLSIPGVRVYARVEMDRRRVLYDPDVVTTPELMALALAHELFHVLDPDCPAALAEPAARQFALDTAESVFSPALGLRLQPDGGRLRLIDPATGLPLPTLDEAAERARRLEAEAEQARQEVERLRALLKERGIEDVP